MNKLTFRQKQLYQYIKSHTRVMPPTFESMRKALNISSNQGIIDKLKALQKKGYLDNNYLPITTLSYK